MDLEKQRKGAKVEDTRWSWVVAFSCCFINFLLYGVARLSGMMMVAVLDTFHTNRASASLPFSVSSSVRNLSGFFVGYLGQRFGLRNTIAVGCFLASLGSGLCFFVSDIRWMVVCWGGIFGTGYGLATCLLPVAINQNFKRHRGIASGISYSGSYIGSFAFPPLVVTLINEYGINGTLLVISGAFLNGCAVAFLFREPHKKAIGNKYDEGELSSEAISDSSEQKSNVSKGEENPSKIWRQLWQKIKSIYRSLKEKKSQTLSSPSSIYFISPPPINIQLSNDIFLSNKCCCELISYKDSSIKQINTFLLFDYSQSPNYCNKSIRYYFPERMKKAKYKRKITRIKFSLGTTIIKKHFSFNQRFSYFPLENAKLVSFGRRKISFHCIKMAAHKIIEMNLSQKTKNYSELDNQPNLSQKQNASSDLLNPPNVSQKINNYSSFHNLPSNLSHKTNNYSDLNNHPNVSRNTNIYSDLHNHSSNLSHKTSNYSDLVNHPNSSQDTNIYSDLHNHPSKLSQKASNYSDLDKHLNLSQYTNIYSDLHNHPSNLSHQLCKTVDSKECLSHQENLSSNGTIKSNSEHEHNGDHEPFFPKSNREEKNIIRNSDYVTDENRVTSNDDDEFSKQFEVEVPIESSRTLKCTLLKDACKCLFGWCRLYTDPMFVIIAVTMSLQTFVLVCMITIIEDFAKDIGIPESQVHYVLMVLSIADLIGSLTLGFITDRGFLSRCNFIILCFFGMFVCQLCISYARSFRSLLTSVALYGIFESGAIITFPLLIAHYIPRKKQAVAVASSNILSSPTVLLVPLVIGYFRDVKGCYSGAFYSLGMTSLSCCCAWLLASCFFAKCRSDKAFPTLTKL